LSASSTIDLHFADDIATMSRRTAFATFLCIELFAGSAAAEQAPKPPGPVMMIHFDYYPKDRERIHALERRLDSAIKRAAVGELGETEVHVDGNDGYLYMYGPDPDRLYAPEVVRADEERRSHEALWRPHGNVRDGSGRRAVMA